MKKIIGLLVAAIICVGMAFVFNPNKQLEGELILNSSNAIELEKDSSDENLDNEDQEDTDKSSDDLSNEESENNIATTVDKENTSEVNKENDMSSGNTSANNTEENTLVNDDNTVISPEPEKIETVTIAINMQKAIDYGIRDVDGFGHLSANGVILATKTVEIKSGDTVYDVLAKVVRENKIQMEYTGVGSAIYIQGIDNLYEFDCGKYSGWMYEVNGIYPNYGVGAYTLKAGDKITFNYTCDLGNDL